jgi:hypothetical protein
MCCDLLRLQPWLAVVAAALMLSTPAAGGCLRSEGVQCPEDFKSLSAVAWAGDHFALAGLEKTATLSGLAVLHVSHDGRTLRKVTIPWPQELSYDANISADVRKLVSLPNKTLVLIANLLTKEPTPKYSGWVIGVSSDGKMIWSQVFADDSASIILNSAYYETTADRIIVVGRKQIGSENPPCANWSQSYIQGVTGTNGKLVQPSIVQGTQVRGPSNRQAIYDIEAGETKGTFVLAGFATAPRKGGGICQDGMLVSTLIEQGVDQWRLADARRLGSKDGNEVAFSIRSIGRGSYLLAGYGRDLVTSAPAAQVYRIKLAPFAIEASKSFPYPEDGSDKDGGDQFRVAVPIEDGSRFVVAGSVRTRAKDAKQAAWRTISADLSQVEPFAVLNEPGGSDILDAAISPNGRVMAVGTAGMDNTDEQLGWFGFIGTSRNVAASNQLFRRDSDRRLPKLSSLPISDGVFQLPPTAASAGAAYLQDQVASLSNIDLALSVLEEKTIGITAHATSGDVDLLLLDASKRLVTFSNFKGSATELMIARLQPGKYTISVIAQDNIRDVEIRISPAREINTSDIARLQTLSEAQRVRLSEQLVSDGYTPAVEPVIAFGAESVRAVIAAQEGASRPIGPKGIGATLTELLGIR